MTDPSSLPVSLLPAVIARAQSPATHKYIVFLTGLQRHLDSYCGFDPIRGSIGRGLKSLLARGMEKPLASWKDFIGKGESYQLPETSDEYDQKVETNLEKFCGNYFLIFVAAGAWFASRSYARGITALSTAIWLSKPDGEFSVPVVGARVSEKTSKLIGHVAFALTALVGFFSGTIGAASGSVFA